MGYVPLPKPPWMSHEEYRAYLQASLDAIPFGIGRMSDRASKVFVVALTIVGLVVVVALWFYAMELGS